MDRGITPRHLLRRSSLLLGLLLALLWPTLATAERRASGEPMTLTGQVVDQAGKPIAGVTVLLEMSRQRFRLSRWGWERQGLLQLPVVSDDDGRFTLGWSWDPFYNSFELVVALPIRWRGKDDFRIFLRRDLTDLLNSPNPLPNPRLVLPDTDYLAWLMAFLESISTPAKARVYEEFGLPDQVDEEAATGLSSWWYFAAGKVHRFRQGEPPQVQQFPPIPEL